jgi:Fe-S oxidoreductase
LAGGGQNVNGQEQGTQEQLAKVSPTALAEAERPLVDVLAAGGVIDPDVLWSCTMCGACVEQCPVDIEHVDHVVDMRRYQVLIESKFPPEAGAMLRNLESRGNPWGENPNAREDWTKDLPFAVNRVTPGEPIDDSIEYLYWVGCAGAFDAKARKTTRAVAELLHTAGVTFAILGKAETCTGDPARRMGNEFTFIELAKQNVQTLGKTFQRRIEKSRRTVITTCPHCFNTLANEYPQLGGEYDVIHHTELLARLLREGRLKPVAPVNQHLTYHDPCFLGRHNRVFSPPRELIGALPGASFTEMPRSSERSFCCGAGGARMWMEEKIGKRINIERTEEAVSLCPDTIVAACPFCHTMLSDGLATKKGIDLEKGGVPDHVEVTDIAQVIHQAVIPETKT